MLAHRGMSMMRMAVKFIFKKIRILLSPDFTITVTNLARRVYVDAYEKASFPLNIELFNEIDFQDDVLLDVKIGDTGIVDWFGGTVTSFKKLYLNLPKFYMWDVDFKDSFDFKNEGTLSEVSLHLSRVSKWKFSGLKSNFVYINRKRERRSISDYFPDITFSGYNAEVAARQIKEVRSIYKLDAKVRRASDYAATPLNSVDIRLENQKFLSDKYRMYLMKTSMTTTDTAKRTNKDIWGFTSYAVDYYSHETSHRLSASFLRGFTSKLYLASLSNKFRRV